MTGDDAGGLFPRRLETERLELERLCHDTVDVREYYELCSHHNPHIEEITRYLPWNPHETPKETADYIDDLERKWEAGERAAALVEVAFERLDLDLVAIPVEGGNEKSRAAVDEYVESLAVSTTA